VLNFHPKFCQPFSAYPLSLEGVIGYGLRFNPALFDAEDFERCAISPVKGSPKRKTEYLAGRLCARQAQHELIGEAQTPARGDDGRPLWAQGLCGSIAHSHGRALAVVARQAQFRGLGVDLEPCLTYERALRLAPSLLTEPEQSRLSALTSGEAQAFCVSLSFSLKESLFKALYPLCLTRFYFQDAEVVDYQNGSARLRLLRDLPGFAKGTLCHGHYLEQQGFLLTLVATAANP